MTGTVLGTVSDTPTHPGGPLGEGVAFYDYLATYHTGHPVSRINS